jgi:hypothetical protein
MDSERVHFEVFVRKNPTSRWVLELATDQPHIALATAEDLVKGGRVAAAMVTKETFDEEARVFHSETLFKENAPDAKRKADMSDWNPLCASPQDLYAERGRERIAGLVEGGLARKRATCFELLHNAELVEQLEATSTEMQHAVQKFAVAEVQIRGGVTHEMIRRIQKQLDQATDRLNSHTKRGAFPKVHPSTFAEAAEGLHGNPDRLFLLGGGVAQALALAHDWDQKVRILLDLLDAAPADGPARKLALAVLDQPLAEIVLSKAGLSGIVGDCEDLAGDLSALTRLMSADAVAKVAAREPAVLKVMPQLSGEAQRLSERMTGEELKGVRAAAARRVLNELHGHKRLRPSDAAGEIEALRALVLSLTAAAGALLPEEDVTAALAARSRNLLSSDFLDAYLQDGQTAEREARALLWLAANVIGAANKRRAARLVQGAVFSLKFETEMLEDAAVPPTARLATLAALQRESARCGLVREDAKAIHDRLGQLGGRLEDKSQLLAALSKAQAPAVKKLQVLLRLASGETAPLGPGADRAREEAMKLVRDDAVRAELVRDEAQMSAVRDLIRDAGLAA